MRILQIRSEFRDNGPGTQALSLAIELHKRGHQVTFAASGGVLIPEIRQAGFTYIEIPTLAVERRGMSDVVHTISAMRKVLKSHQFDIAHAHNAASIVMLALAARSCRRAIGLVHSVRGIELRATHQWRNWIYKVNPAHFLAVSEYTRQQLTGFGVSPDRITVTYNGVRLDRFDPLRVSPTAIQQEFKLRGGPVIGHVGVFSGWKGQDVLVRALPALCKQHPGLQLILVGQGPALESVKSLAKSLNVADHVVFPGMRRDIPEILAAIDLYCQPSTRGEMFPNAIVEAMAMQKSWVGSDISGLAELADDGRTGTVLAPGDVNALAAAIAGELGDAERLARRGMAARVFVERNFTIEKVCDRVENVYDAVRDQRG